MSSTIENLRHNIRDAHRQLGEHPIYRALHGIEDLRLFMEWHVFAVWDFVSLLKRLQRELTGSSLPWTPPANRRAARLVNEIVLGEESDLLPDGSPISHFELYLGAMREVGADTAQIEGFVDSLRRGISLEAALARAGLASPVAAFVRATLNCALQGDVPQVLGSFFFGRENAIPSMFRALLAGWRLDAASAPLFVHYLQRHIEVDQQQHGPMAEIIIDELVGDDAQGQEALLTSALAALRQRQLFWTALHHRMSAAPMLEVAE